MNSSSSSDIKKKLGKVNTPEMNEGFPLVVLQQIFSYLPPEVLATLSVNRRWNRILKDNKDGAIWQEKLREHFPERYAALKDEEYVQWYEEFVEKYQQAYSHCMYYPGASDDLIYFVDRQKMSAEVRILFTWIKSNDYKAWIARRCSLRDCENFTDTDVVSQIAWAQRLCRQEILDYIFHLGPHDVTRAIACHQSNDLIESLASVNHVSARLSLCLAAETNHLSFIKYLVGKYPELLDYGYTDAHDYDDSPLVRAAAKGHWAIVEYFLVNRKPNPELLVTRRKEFIKALMYASQHDVQVAMQLIAYNKQHKVVEDSSDLGRDCLQLAAYYQNSDLLRVLLRENKAFVHATLGEANTPLIELIFAYHDLTGAHKTLVKTLQSKAVIAVKLLLAQEGADLSFASLLRVAKLASDKQFYGAVIQVIKKMAENITPEDCTAANQFELLKLLNNALQHEADDLALVLAKLILSKMSDNLSEEHHPIVLAGGRPRMAVVKGILQEYPEAYTLLLKRPYGLAVDDFLKSVSVANHLRQLDLVVFAEGCRENRGAVLDSLNFPSMALTEIFQALNVEQIRILIEVLTENAESKAYLYRVIGWKTLAEVFNALSDEVAQKIADVLFKELKDQMNGKLYIDFIIILSAEKLAIFDAYMGNKKPRIICSIGELKESEDLILKSDKRDVILDKIMGELVEITLRTMPVRALCEITTENKLDVCENYKYIAKILPTHKLNVFNHLLISAYNNKLITLLANLTQSAQDFKDFIGTSGLSEGKKDQYFAKVLPKLIKFIADGDDYILMKSKMSSKQIKKLWDALLDVKECSAQQYENIMKVLPEKRKKIFEENCKVIDKPTVVAGRARRGNLGGVL